MLCTMQPHTIRHLMLKKMLISDFGNKTKKKSVKKLSSLNFGHFSCSLPTFHAIRYNHKVRRLSFCKGGEEFIRNLISYR